MEDLQAVALRAAQAAARIHLTHFRRFSVESAQEKAQSDFVTQVDLEAQRAAISVVLEAFPHHRILAEEDAEGGGTGNLVRQRGWPGEGEYLWIIDPLDGTTNYLHGHPMFGASVAVGRLFSEGEPPVQGQVQARGKTPGVDPSPCNPGLSFHGCLEAGAVVAPRTGERWWARRGGGAWKNGLPISVSKTLDLSKALIGTGFPFKEPEIVPRYAEQFKRVLPHTGGVRRGGSAALDLCYLAEGMLDGFWEEDYLSPWDSAAGLVILSEAGGIASRMDGFPIDLEDGSILAGNSATTVEGLTELLEGP